MSTRTPLSAEDLAARLDRVRLSDEPAFRRRLDSVSGRGALRRLAAAMDDSIAWVERRHDSVPAVSLSAGLPISEKGEQIAAAIRAHEVIVVCGETGSGKSTQLPKICLQCGLGTRGVIGHTQPRRLAARSIAARVAEELGEPPGKSVGYKVRFSDRTGPDCRVKLMTDGILLAESRQDRWLRQYDALIIDEAHERSLNIDFLLGYIKRIRGRRPDLRVIVTSATIDPEKFSRHFDDAPVIEVSGRTYPVEDRYRPPDDEEEGIDQIDGILSAVEELAAGDAGRGDILVFLAGEREIRETADALRKRHPERVEILPLFARLSAADQDRVFRPGGRRRIVLATNIAETSLTVPGIRYVVDPGFARISRYGYRNKIQRLEIEPISRASANQRRGRCGRERDGVCIRLYSEQDFLGRPEFTDPEIRRTNLASVILQMECNALGRIEDFPFVDPPDSRHISDGYRLLRELGAIDADDQVTRLGRKIARFPLDPRLGRMLVAGGDSGCLREILPIVAFLSIHDPRERPMEARDQADEKHRQWLVPGSDPLGLVQLWEVYMDHRRHSSVNKQRRWCRDNFLSFPRMREWHEVHQQLLAQAKDMGLAVNDQSAAKELVHKAFLSGMLGHIGVRDENEYAAPRGGRFVVWPGSGLHGAGARWVVAASLVQTSRVFAHTLAGVEPEWIEQAAGHLVTRSYEDPYWDARRGQVTARERVSLYGLVLAAGRPVDFGRIDPAAARTVFIREALAEDRLGVSAPFIDHNRALLSRVADLEARLRRRDLLADRQTLARFFSSRVPEEVRDRRSFERWRHRAEESQPDLLFMSVDDVLAGELPGPIADAYPDSIEVEGNALALEYCFEPGSDNDGVTIITPRSLLAMLDPSRLDWLIPGYLEEKVIAMIRVLPKPLRRRLVPAPDVGHRCMAELDAGKGDFRSALARALTREAGERVDRSVWAGANLPAHLAFNVRVVDGEGKALGEGRDLAALQDRFGFKGPVRVPATGRRYAGMTEWELGDLPRTVALREGDAVRHLFPALHDDGDAVSLKHYASRDEALEAHKEGTLRLFRLACRQADAYLAREVRKSRLAPSLAGLGGAGGDPVDDLIRLAFLETFLPDGSEPVRDAESFEARLAEGRGRVVAKGVELQGLTEEIVGRWREYRARVRDGLVGPGAEEAARDLVLQLDDLVYPGWLRSTPVIRLKAFPRYLKAVGTRLEKIRQRDGRAAAKAAMLHPHMERIERWRSAGRSLAEPEVANYRWMVEEYRVSLFDQRLGTAVKVSPERLDRQWERLTRGTELADS